MPYNILTSTGSTTAARRRVVNEVNTTVGDEMRGSVPDFIRFYGLRLFPLRWMPAEGGSVSRSGITVDSRASHEEAVASVIAALRKAKTDSAPGPKPPTPKPGPTPPAPTEPTIWFREEQGNLVHRESHAGLDPAEFFAVRADALANGYIADGACNA